MDMGMQIYVFNILILFLSEMVQSRLRLETLASPFASAFPHPTFST